jgi:hypothetical protein
MGKQSEDQAQAQKREQEWKLPLEQMPQISNVVSAGECTGLMPEPPQDAMEQAAYQSLWSTSLPPVWPEEDPPTSAPPMEEPDSKKKEIRR